MTSVSPNATPADDAPVPAVLTAEDQRIVNADHEFEVGRLRTQLAEARAERDRLLICAAIVGQGADPEGYYNGTPGARLRELEAAERQRDNMRSELTILYRAEQELQDRLRAVRDLTRDTEGNDIDPDFEITVGDLRMALDDEEVCRG